MVERARRRWISRIPWLLLLLAGADLVALKAELLNHRSEVLAVLFGLTAVIFVIRWIQLLQLVASGPRQGRQQGELLTVSGLLLALAGGSTNWLLSLQGYVILVEGDSVVLNSGGQLQDFTAGPLARLEELGITIALGELELVATGQGRFYPASRIRVETEGEPPDELEVTPHTEAEYGPLRFHQGAFGFAPRIVILQGEEPTREVFDRVVPFLTQRQGEAGVAFDGSFDLESESLRVVGMVDLESLDEGMRGHSTLQLAVEKAGQPLGEGQLLPGIFASIDEGYSVGFAGLEKWSEIVVSRRNYGFLVLAGTGLALLGGVLWALAGWRER
ncbi:MAG: hypothetical protein WBC09_14255 [Thermoanaerobaculia bacterium]